MGSQTIVNHLEWSPTMKSYPIPPILNTLIKPWFLGVLMGSSQPLGARKRRSPSTTNDTRWSLWWEGWDRWIINPKMDGSIRWVKQCHKPPFGNGLYHHLYVYLWWWLGDGLWHCFSYYKNCHFGSTPIWKLVDWEHLKPYESWAKWPNLAVPLLCCRPTSNAWGTTTGC